MVALTWGESTDVGTVRQVNEDCLLAAGTVFAVADGMGGRAGGDRASQLTVEVLRQLTTDGPATSATVLDAVRRASVEITTAARDDAVRTGMGCTVVGLALVEDAGERLWFGFNVGDSRLYRYAAGELEQISVDHSEVQELIAAGRVPEAQRYTHPRAHVITRVLGSDPPPEADCWLFYPTAGERFLLCSDGLSSMLPAVRIRDLLATVPEPARAAGSLVAEAVEAGARDNVSAVVVHVGGAADEVSTGPRRQWSS
jgi:protein phosphatase